MCSKSQHLNQIPEEISAEKTRHCGVKWVRVQTEFSNE